ncbi:hypothetical protein TPCG7_11570 [Cutibacterium granulosum]|nr:hypothetical protein [Cutibacterium granulosum]BDQ40508.1 hypothetical protein TPCG7_11570 [Cutibacterium granulosum]
MWKSEYQITNGDWFLFRLGLRIDTDAYYACAARDPCRDVLPRRSNMAVEATTTCKRVVGPVVAAALMVGAVGVTAAPAQAAQTSGPSDYTAQAGKAADYINGHSADLTKGNLGPELDGALALISAGKTDAATFTTIKSDIKAKGPSYCTSKNVGGCAKVTITLLAAGESPTFEGTDYAKQVTSLPDSALKEYPTNQALDMIALERLGKPIPQKLLTAVTEYATTTPKWDDPDTDGLTLTALSHVESPDKQKAVTSLVKRLDADKQGGAWGPKGQGPSVNTTAWVAAGLDRAGDAGHKAQAVAGQTWLVKQQQTDGSFTGSVKTPAGKMMATTQVVPALRQLASYDTVGASQAKMVQVH